MPYYFTMAFTLLIYSIPHVCGLIFSKKKIKEGIDMKKEDRVVVQILVQE